MRVNNSEKKTDGQAVEQTREPGDLVTPRSVARTEAFVQGYVSRAGLGGQSAIGRAGLEARSFAQRLCHRPGPLGHSLFSEWLAAILGRLGATDTGIGWGDRAGDWSQPAMRLPRWRSSHSEFAWHERAGAIDTFAADVTSRSLARTGRPLPVVADRDIASIPQRLSRPAVPIVSWLGVSTPAPDAVPWERQVLSGTGALVYSRRPAAIPQSLPIMPGRLDVIPRQGKSVILQTASNQLPFTTKRIESAVQAVQAEGRLSPAARRRAAPAQPVRPVFHDTPAANVPAAIARRAAPRRLYPAPVSADADSASEAPGRATTSLSIATAPFAFLQRRMGLKQTLPVSENLTPPAANRAVWPLPIGFTAGSDVRAFASTAIRRVLARPAAMLHALTRAASDTPAQAPRAPFLSPRSRPVPATFTPALMERPDDVQRSRITEPPGETGYPQQKWDSPAGWSAPLPVPALLRAIVRRLNAAFSSVDMAPISTVAAPSARAELADPAAPAPFDYVRPASAGIASTAGFARAGETPRSLSVPWSQPTVDTGIVWPIPPAAAASRRAFAQAALRFAATTPSGGPLSEPVSVWSEAGRLPVPRLADRAWPQGPRPAGPRSQSSTTRSAALAFPFEGILARAGALFAPSAAAPALTALRPGRRASARAAHAKLSSPTGDRSSADQRAERPDVLRRMPTATPTLAERVLARSTALFSPAAIAEVKSPDRPVGAVPASEAHFVAPNADPAEPKAAGFGRRVLARSAALFAPASKQTVTGPERSFTGTAVRASGVLIDRPIRREPRTATFAQGILAQAAALFAPPVAERRRADPVASLGTRPATAVFFDRPGRREPRTAAFAQGILAKAAALFAPPAEERRRADDAASLRTRPATTVLFDRPGRREPRTATFARTVLSNAGALFTPPTAARRRDDATAPSRGDLPAPARLVDRPIRHEPRTTTFARTIRSKAASLFASPPVADRWRDDFAAPSRRPQPGSAVLFDQVIRQDQGRAPASAFAAAGQSPVEAHAEPEAVRFSRRLLSQAAAFLLPASPRRRRAPAQAAAIRDTAPVRAAGPGRVFGSRRAVTDPSGEPAWTSRQYPTTMSSVERIPELPALLARLASSMTTPLLLRRPQGALKTRSGVASESARTTQAPHFVHDEPHAPIGPNGTRLPETRRGVQAQRLAPRRRLLAIDRALSLAAGLPVEEAHFDLDFLVSDIRELASQVVEAQLIAPVQTFLLATVHRLQSDLQPRMVAYARVAHNISSEAGGYSHPAQLSTYVQKQTSYARSLAGRLLPAAALPMPTAAITSFARPAGALATVPTTSHRSQGDRPAADWPSAEILSPTYPLAHAPLQFAHETGRAFDGVATYPQQARQAMAGASPLTSSTIDLQGRSTVKTMALPSIATLEQGIKKKFESTLALQKVAAGTSPTGMGASPVKPEHGANLTSSEKGAEANDVHLLANEVWIQLKRRLRIEAERLGPRQ